MKSALVSLAFLVTLTGVSVGQDGTEGLLLSPHATTFVRLRFLGGADKSMQYIVDSTDDNFLPLKNASTLVCNSGLSVRAVDFNPLLDDISVAQKESDDTNYSSITKFITALTGVAKSINLAPPAPGRPGAAPSECPLAAVLTGDDIKRWADSGKGLEGTKKVLAEVKTTIATLKADVASLEAALANLITTGSTKAFDACGREPGSSFPTSAQWFHAASIALDSKRHLLDDLASLQGRLTSFVDSTGWRDSGKQQDRDLEIANATFAPQKQDTMTITVVHRSFEVDPTGGLTVRQVSATYTLIFRQFSGLVPEVAAGVLYTSLRYPTYGTAQVDGKTVVARTADVTNAVNAGLMLNGVCRCLGTVGFPVFPMVQIGVTTAKEYPGLLAGVGVRFLKPWALSLSGGAIITWYKDLSTLKPGDPVTGTAEIQNNLKVTRSPVEWYLALQYSF